MHLIGDTLTFSLFDSHDLYPSSLMSSVIEENSMLHDPSLAFNDTSMNSDYIIQDLESNPERWNSKKLMCWIMTTCNENSRDYEDINLRWFNNFSSADIQNITENDFLKACKNRNYNLGSWLYTKFRQVLDVPTTDRYENMLRFSPPCDSINRIDCVSQSSGSDGEAEPVVQKRQRGRPKSSNKARRKSEHKTGKLWEFLRDLLLNPDYCPSIICWENYEEGVFKFVSSEKVAKLWGSKRGNNVMNYEKLSRAMRYYYKTQVLAPVIGKRLVYRFGINAKGWHTDNPNFLKSNNYTSKL